MNYHSLTFECSCGSTGHVIKVQKWDDDPEVCVSVAIPNDTLWNRLVGVFKYLFGNQCKYVESAEVVLSKEDRDRLKDFLS